MKRILPYCIFLICLTALSENGVVSSARCPLYATPDFSVPAVVFLQQGQQLSYQIKKDGWATTELPVDAPVWVASTFCRNGFLISDTVFRTEPSAASEQYPFNGDSAGLPCKVLATAEDGFWLKICPVPGLSGYFSISHIEKKKTAPGTKDPDDWNLSEAKSYSAEGRLTVLESPVFGASHQLILDVNHRKIPIAYVNPGDTNLRLWAGRQVVIYGSARWSGKSCLPILKAEKIAPSWN